MEEKETESEIAGKAEREADKEEETETAIEK